MIVINNTFIKKIKFQLPHFLTIQSKRNFNLIINLNNLYNNPPPPFSQETKDHPSICSFSGSTKLDYSNIFGSYLVLILIFRFGIGGTNFLKIKFYKKKFLTKNRFFFYLLSTSFQFIF